MYDKTIEVLNQESDLAYYLLGAFITDGNVYDDPSRTNTRKSCISSAEFEWLQEINSHLNNEGKLHEKHHDGVVVHFTLSFHNSEIYYWLVKHECVENKSLIVKMPQIPEKHLADFVRGCIDGDGTITSCQYSKIKNEKTYYYTQNLSYICSASYDFLFVLREQLSKLGMNGSLFRVNQKPSLIRGKEIIPRNPLYRLSFSGKSALKFVSWAYYEGHKISLPRKKLLAIKLKDSFNKVI
jgi:intein/homing endonuclease